MFAPLASGALPMSSGMDSSGVGSRLAEPPTITGHPYLSPYEDLKLKPK